MAQYASSTQKANWLLPSEKIEARRRCCIVDVRPVDQSLTMQEESILRRHHERRILRFVGRIGFPDKIAATAIAYFKRFYIDRSVLDYNPAVISMSCLYASMKIEEVILSADELVDRVDTVLNGISDSAANPAGEAATESVDGTATRVTADMLLSEELPFLNLLQFHLICYHPYRSLSMLRTRICEDAELPGLNERPTVESKGGGSPLAKTDVTPLEKLFGLATRIVNRRVLLTDMPLTHSPAVIAIAAVVVSGAELAETEGCSGIEPELLQSRLLSSMGGEVVSAIKLAIADVTAMREGGLAADDVVKELEARRRKLCKPENDPTSELYQKMQRDKEEEADRKRLKRAKEMTDQKAAKDKALFAPPPRR